MEHLFGRLIAVNGRRATLSLSTHDLAKLERLVNKRNQTVELDFSDGRQITPGQRKKAYALLSVIAKATGYTKDQAKLITKQSYTKLKHQASFSLSNTSETNARHYIDYLLRTVLRMNFPLDAETYRMVANTLPFQKLCLKYHRCMACGAPATRITYYGHNVILLCEKHQREVESLGIRNLIKKYHLA